MFALLSISCLLAVSYAIGLPESRQACKSQEITYIPNEFDYYEEAFELSFDTSLSMNNVAVTQIVEEECGLRDKEDHIWSGRRSKRSVISKGIRHLPKLLHSLYHHGKGLFKPQLLEKISSVLNKNKRFMGRLIAAEVFTFYELVWTDLNSIRKDAKDDNFEVMLENALRGSIQMLLQSGKMSELLLNEPSVLEKIKRRLPWENSALLEMVEATNVKCHQGHRDSQVVIFMKLKIPKVSKTTVQVCDDIGRVVNRTYQYYDLPTGTFSRDGEHYAAAVNECLFENFLYCPKRTINPTVCHKDNIQACPLITDQLPRNFYRELAVGFAVYGDFSQVIFMKEKLASQWLLRPHFLYHIVPQTNELVMIGNQKLRQDTGAKDTVITQLHR